MRAIWKGAISFGLVNIPVGLYSATRLTSEIKFKLLRRSDLSPIKYKRVTEADGREVPWEQIAKGYEYEKRRICRRHRRRFQTGRDYVQPDGRYQRICRVGENRSDVF